MKIFLESPSRMIISDSRTGSYIGAGLFIALGIAICFISQGSLFALSLGVLFMLGGTYIISTKKFSKIILDKNTGKGNFALQSILLRNVREIDLPKIKKLAVRRELKTYGGAKYANQYNLFFVMTDKEELQFPFGSVTRPMAFHIATSDDNRKKEAQPIADFLGVPLELVVPPPELDLYWNLDKRERTTQVNK